MFQTKEQDKTPEEGLSEVEIDNLPEKEFRVMIIKMIKELGRTMDAQSEKLEVFFFFFPTHTHCILFLQEINRLTPSIVHG